MTLGKRAPLRVDSSRRVGVHDGDATSALSTVLTARNALVAHVLSLIAAFIVLLYYGNHQWFFADEWEFITRNLPGAHRLGLFAPHNEHWITIPLLVYRSLFAVFGLHSYLPYILVVIVVHVITAHLIWRLAVRAGAMPWIATAVTAVFLALGVGYEELIDAFQMTFSLSLCFGLGWLLFNDCALPTSVRLAGGWALGLVASMSSGIALAMIAVVGLAASGRRGVRDAVAVISVPVLANVAWYAGVRPHATLPNTGSQLLMLPEFVWRGLSATADGAVGLPVLGIILLMALAVWVVARNRAVPSIAWSTAAGAVLLLVIVGYGRVSLGIDQAAAPRYLYLTAALLVCPTALALTSLTRRRPPLEACVVALLALSALHGAYILRASIRGQFPIRTQDRAVVMAAARVVTSGSTLLGTQPDPFYGPDIDVSDLRTLVQSGALPITGVVDPESLLVVQSRIEMAAGPTAMISGAWPALRVLSGTSITSTGCASVASSSGTVRAQLTFSDPSSFSLTTPRRAAVTVTLSSVTDPTRTAPPVTYQAVSSTPLWIGVSAPGAIIEVGVPAGTAICGVSVEQLP